MWEKVPCASAILISGVQSTLSLSRPHRGGLPDQKDLYLMVVQLDHFVMDLRRTENMTKSRGYIKVEHDDINLIGEEGERERSIKYSYNGKV